MVKDSIKLNLLIVEDDRFIRKIYTEILKDINKLTLHELETAENAIEYTKEHKPDIVIMDYKLPGMNGLEATKQIVMAHPETVVLVISGDDRSTLEEEMLEVGAVSFLKKPVRGKLLYFTIMNFAEIIISKKKLKAQIEHSDVKKAETKASSAYTCTIVNNKNSDTFLDNFDNSGIDATGKTLLNEDKEIKDVHSFYEQLGDDAEYIEDFIESYDNLYYAVEALDTVVETELLLEISRLMKENSAKLNTLLEFATITYTLTNISDFMDKHDLNTMCDIPMKKLAVFLGDFFELYDQWVKSVFINKDASDIHFMDVTLMSFGLQMDSIFSDVNVLSEDDETAVDEGGSVEFF